MELKLNKCGITRMNFLPLNLRSLSLNENEIKELRSRLPNCKYFRLSMKELKIIHIEAPFLELINLNHNELSSIPDTTFQMILSFVDVD